MPPRRPKNLPTPTQSNVSNRANNHEKPLVYQSSLEQFMKPITSKATQKYQFTTPNKRKPQTFDTTTCSYPSKKRKRSSRSPPATKNCETAAPGADLTTPIIIPDNSDDEVWDGDTLINSASTTRTLCADLEKTTFGSKSQLILKELQVDHTPSTTRARNRSLPSTELTSSPLDKVSIVIPSSQIHERLPPLVISLRDEELRVSDSQPPPQAPPADEIIPSSQSQYLLPYVISPQRVRKFIGKPPPSPKELIPCSQGSNELDLVFLAKSRPFDIDPKGSLHESESTIERMDDGSNESDGKVDRPPLADQSNLEPGQQFKGQATYIRLDAPSLTPPTTNQTEEHAKQDTGSTPVFQDIGFSQFESSQSAPPNSLSSYGRNDSQYTFVEETCPSDIHEFLEELEKRTDIEFSPSENPPTTPEFRPACLLRPDNGKLIDEKVPDTCSSLSLAASSSQFSFGRSSQYTSMEVSLPSSDIAEFLDRLENLSDSEAEGRDR